MYLIWQEYHIISADSEIVENSKSYQKLSQKEADLKFTVQENYVLWILIHCFSICRFDPLQVLNPQWEDLKRITDSIIHGFHHLQGSHRFRGWTQQPVMTEGTVLTNFSALVQQCRRDMGYILQLEGSYGGLLKVRKCSFPYLGVALSLSQNWKIGQDCTLNSFTENVLNNLKENILQHPKRF